jgi:hypothetical protein
MILLNVFPTLEAFVLAGAPIAFAAFSKFN